MYKTINVNLNERVVVFRGGLPVKYLGPGKYRFWRKDKLEIFRFDTDCLILIARPEVLAVIPKSERLTVAVSTDQRGVLYRDGRPRWFLRPGTHNYWNIDPSAKLEVLSVNDLMPKLTKEMISLIPKREYTSVIVKEYERGLRYERGKLSEVLSPGLYNEWVTPDRPVAIEIVDMRITQIVIPGQELMTSDKVTLRLTLSVEYAVENPALASVAAKDGEQSVYLMVQLAARDFVSSVTLDQLLERRAELTAFMNQKVASQAKSIGLKVSLASVKDVILPGEMRALFNKVIEAEKQATANVILRREETAATRSMANAAKVIAANPVMQRLKELEAYKEIAEAVGEVRVVLGQDKIERMFPSVNE